MRINKYLREARKNIMKSRFQKANDILDMAYNIDPENIDTLLCKEQVKIDMYMK